MRYSRFLKQLVGVMFVVLLLIGCNEKDADSNDVTKDETENEAENESSSEVNETGFPIVDDEIEISMLAPSVPSPDWNDIMIFNEYEEMTNMNIDWLMVSKDGIKEKTNVMLGTNDYPDAFHTAGISAADLVRYGKQGVFIPLNDLIDEYAPNLKALLDEYPEIEKGLTMPDGNIYSFPTIYDPEYNTLLMNWKLWLNSEFLDELGFDEPTTLDEFYNYLVAVKEENPTGNGENNEVPLQVNGDGNLINIMKGSFGIGTRGISHEMVDADPETGELRFMPTTDAYKEMLQFINKLYEEELLNQDLYTVKSEQATAKGKEGLFGAVVTTNPATGYNLDYYVGSPTLEGPHGDHLYSNFVSSLKNIGSFVITDENPYPEATVRWIDHFYGDEGMRLFFMGIEDETFYVDDDGEYVYTDLIEDNPEGLLRTEAISKYLTWRTGSYPSMVVEKYFKTPTEPADKVEDDKPEEIWPPFTHTEDELEIISSIGGDIEDYVEETRALLITGEMSFDKWDEFVDTIENMGLDEYMDAYNAAFERYQEQ